MNLIEQLGGYEYLNGFYKRAVAHGFTLTEIKEELLKYRRQHNIFEVGDKVVFNREKSDDTELYTVEYVLDDGSFLGINDYRQAFPSKRFTHATPEEIKAGKRLEVKSEN